MIRDIINKFNSFIENEEPIIYSYYCDDCSYPRESFLLLDSLYEEVKTSIEKIKASRNTLNNFKYFEYLDYLEDCLLCLENIINYSKWLRSSIIKGRNKNEAEIDFVLEQNQSISSFSRKLGYEDGDVGELEIQLRNKIKETYYDLDGGLRIRYNFIDGNKIQINTIIDTLNSDTILGKDINKSFLIVDEDLSVVDKTDCFKQSVNILLTMKRNDNPEHPNYGLDKNIISNKNYISQIIPSITRQLYDLISTDDTIDSFVVKNIEQQSDKVSLSIEVRAVENFIYNTIIYGN